MHKHLGPGRRGGRGSPPAPVTRLARRVCLSPETYRGLEVLAAVLGITPEQAVAALVTDFLKTHEASIEEHLRDRQRPLAPIIDLEDHRADRVPRPPSAESQ
jgi:hypothetical protein